MQYNVNKPECSYSASVQGQEAWQALTGKGGWTKEHKGPNTKANQAWKGRATTADIICTVIGCFCLHQMRPVKECIRNKIEIRAPRLFGFSLALKKEIALHASPPPSLFLMASLINLILQKRFIWAYRADLMPLALHCWNHTGSFGGWGLGFSHWMHSGNLGKKF